MVHRRKSPATTAEAIDELDRIQILIDQGIAPEDVNKLRNLSIAPNLTLEDFQAQRDIEQALACQEMENLAKQFRQRDAQRKKLWGNKFPLRLGDKPPENGRPINPVKKKAKGRRK